MRLELYLLSSSRSSDEPIVSIRRALPLSDFLIVFGLFFLFIYDTQMLKQSCREASSRFVHKPNYPSGGGCDRLSLS